MFPSLKNSRRPVITAAIATSIILASTQFHAGMDLAGDIGLVAAISSTPKTIGFSDNAELLWASQAEVDSQMDGMVYAGAKSIRIAIPWSSVQPTQNALNWADVDKVVNSAVAHNLSVLAVIAFTPGWAAAPGGSGITSAPASPAAFGAFTGQVASRYAGKVGAYEVWNEPNGSMFYSPAPNASGYTALLKAAYPAIKSADPSAIVIAGSLGSTETINGNVNPVDFARGMYAAGAKGFFDALSYHPYQYQLPFTGAIDLPASPMNQVSVLRRLMVSNGDGAKKIWATEYGQSTSFGDEWVQNAFVTDLMMKWQELPFAGPVYLFQYKDQQTGSSDPEMNYGLVKSDGTHKVAASGFGWVMANGVPVSAEFNRFQSAPSAGLGAPLTPVVQVSGKWAQVRENGTLWETATNQFFSSPTAVATRAIPSGFVPTTAFANGYQDFSSPYGLRIWWSPATGAQLVGGGIVAAWTPPMGLALTDEVPLPGGGVKVSFQHGSISWVPGVGTTVGP